jgi:hypothetical protein
MSDIILLKELINKHFENLKNLTEEHPQQDGGVFFAALPLAMLAGLTGHAFVTTQNNALQTSDKFNTAITSNTLKDIRNGNLPTNRNLATNHNLITNHNLQNTAQKQSKLLFSNADLAAASAAATAAVIIGKSSVFKNPKNNRSEQNNQNTNDSNAQNVHQNTPNDSNAQYVQGDQNNQNTPNDSNAQYVQGDQNNQNTPNDSNAQYVHQNTPIDKLRVLINKHFDVLRQITNDIQI